MKTMSKFMLFLMTLVLVVPVKDIRGAKTKGFLYNDIVLDIQSSGNQSITFATHDQRPYVMDGTRKPDLAGYLRNAVGMAYPTSTNSQLPLAEVMSQVFSNSFEAKGFETRVVNTAHTESPGEVLKKCKATGSDRLIILTLKEWQSDGYGGHAEIKYDIVMQVYDQEGILLEEKTAYAEKEQMGFSKKKAWDFLKEETRKFFKKKMEEIFNSKEIISAIIP
ncbi:MAG: hypothetical protein V2I54_04465 [Bacteroidales bacterium]|jgi:hypothetical protein|nr:hypothetical protein [Bacteroidales bacterium]